MTSAGISSRRGKLLAMGLSTLLVLLALELGLRLFSWGMVARLAPATRDELPSDDDHCVRVLAVGDSFTFGVGATPGNDYPAKLERLLARKVDDGGCVRVYNRGQPTLNSSEVLAALPHLLEALDPHAVTLLVGQANWRNFTGYDPSGTRGALGSWLRDALEGLRLVRLVRFAKGHHRGLERHGEASPGIYGGGHTAREPFPLDYHLPSEPTDWQPSEHFTRGREALAMGKPEAAMAHFRAGLEAYPDDASLAWGVGTSLTLGHDYEQARRWFHTASEWDPQDPNPYVGLGSTYVLQHDIERDEAARAFERATELAPSFGKAHCGLGTVMMLRHEFDQALAYLRRGIQVDPEDSCSYMQAAHVFHMKGDIQGSNDFLTELESSGSAAESFIAMLREDDLHASVATWLRHDLLAATRATQRHGIPLLLQTYPGETFANEVIRTAARESSLPVADHQEAFAVLAQRRRGELSEYFVSDGHCSDKGYGVMARVLADALAEAGIDQAR